MLEAELVPAPERDSRRLMVVLHGLGDSMEGYRWMPQAMGFPWLNYLLVNAPDLYFGGYAWYDFSGDADSGVRRSRALLLELLEHWRGKGYAPEQTLMLGFSQGSLMTLDAGLRYDQRLAGLVGVSGYVHRLEELLAAVGPDARRMPVFMSHGTMDPLIPIEPVRRQVEQLKSGGLSIEWHEFAKVHTIDEARELGMIRSFVQKCLRA